MADLDAATECEVDLWGLRRGEARRNLIVPAVQGQLRERRGLLLFSRSVVAAVYTRMRVMRREDSAPRFDRAKTGR